MKATMIVISVRISEIKGFAIKLLTEMVAWTSIVMSFISSEQTGVDANLEGKKPLFISFLNLYAGTRN